MLSSLQTLFYLTEIEGQSILVFVASYNFSINITPAVEYSGLSACNICFLVQVTGKVRSVWSAYQACESQRALPARGLAFSVSPIKLSFTRVKNAKTN